MKRFFGLLPLMIVAEYVTAQDSASITSFTHFPIEDTLELEPVFEIKKRARNIFLVDSVFWIRNTNESDGYYLTGYTKKGKKIGNEYVRKGTGTNEVTAAMSAGFWANRKMWIHDLILDKVVIADGFDKALPEKVQLSEYKLPFGFYWIGMIDSNTVIGAGVDNSPEKLCEVDLSTGKVIKKYGSFGAPPANIPFNSWKMAYQSFLFVKPGGDKVALACRFTDRVEFFDRTKGTDKIVNGPDNLDVVFNPIQTGNLWAMERIEKTRFTFLNGVATEKYLYLLYAGHQHEDPIADNGHYIFVYDWDGNPVKRIRLSAYVRSFLITEDGKHFYGEYSGKGIMLHGELR